MDVKDLEAIRQIVKEETDEIRRELKKETNEIKQELKKETDEIRQETQNIYTRLEAVEEETKRTRLILENETNPNIKAIAEGHLDLSRKLHEAIKIDNEKEMMKIRLNILEGEMKLLKKQMVAI